MSARTPAPPEGSNPAMVITTGCLVAFTIKKPTVDKFQAPSKALATLKRCRDLVLCPAAAFDSSYELVEVMGFGEHRYACNASGACVQSLAIVGELYPSQCQHWDAQTIRDPAQQLESNRLAVFLLARGRENGSEHYEVGAAALGRFCFLDRVG